MIANTPQQQAGNPEDLDGALLLLWSDASSFMTGSTITVDGGHMQSPFPIIRAKQDTFASAYLVNVYTKSNKANALGAIKHRIHP